MLVLWLCVLPTCYPRDRSLLRTNNMVPKLVLHLVNCIPNLGFNLILITITLTIVIAITSTVVLVIVLLTAIFTTSMNRIRSTMLLTMARIGKSTPHPKHPKPQTVA